MRSVSTRSGGQVAVSMNGETALIDVRTGERTDTFEGSGGAFSPDGRSLVVNSAEGEDPDSLVLVDVSSGNRLPLKGAQTSGVRHRDFSRDSSMLATSGNDGLVRIWETTTGREVYTLRGHTGRTLAGAFSPDGTTIYTTGLDRAIFSWDLVGRNTLEHTVALAPRHRHLRRELRRHERRVGCGHRSLRQHAAVAGHVAVGRPRRRDRLRPQHRRDPSERWHDGRRRHRRLDAVAVGRRHRQPARGDPGGVGPVPAGRQPRSIDGVRAGGPRQRPGVRRDHARTPRRRARRGRRDRCRSHLGRR